MASLLNIHTIKELTQILIVDPTRLTDFGACVTNALDIVAFNKDRFFIVAQSHLNAGFTASSVNLFHAKEVSDLDDLVVLFK